MAVGGRDTGLAVRKEEETKILQRWNRLGDDFRNPRMRRRAVRTAWTEPAMTSRRTRCGQFNATVCALPVLVANGVTDVMIPAEHSFAIARTAPNAKLVLYPDAGHAFLFQYVEEFTREVLAFL